MESSVLWSAVAALGACLSAAVAAVYTFLTYRLVRGQSEPNVIIYVRNDDSRPTVIQIVIANIGRGIATDLRFSASQPIPHRAFGVREQDAPAAGSMTDGPLIEGIAALGPGDTRKITWGQFGGLRKALGDNAIRVTCNYKHGDRSMPSVTGLLEVRSFKSTEAIESEALRIIKQLQSIAESVERIAKGYNLG